MRIHLVGLLLLGCLSSLCASAQSGWGSSNVTGNGPMGPQDTSCILGVVQTTERRAVQDAIVELTASTPPVSTYTAGDGSFTLCNLRTGEYDVIARKGIYSDNQHVSTRPASNFVTLIIRSERQSGDGRQPVSAAQLAVPGKARGELEKAEQAFRSNRVVDATHFVEKALKLWPRYAEALTLRALIERHQHYSDLALADAKKAVEYDPNFGTAYFVLGSIYIDVHRLDDAIPMLDHGIMVAPTYWQGYYEMGRAMLYKGDFEAALRHVAKASTLAPIDYPQIHLVKGYAYLGLKNQSAARIELEAYLKLEPNTENVSRAKQVLNQLSGDK